MREMFKRQGSVAKIVVILLIGVTAGVVVGGAVHLFGSGGSNEAQAASSAGSTPAGPPPPPVSNAPLAEGSVVADDSAASLPAEPTLGAIRTAEGAVAAFTSYASWLVGSSAAAEDPTNAVKAVGGPLLNATDARLLADMQRAPGDGFRASQGVYRILGHAGSQAAPTEVMVEVTAPLTVSGKTRWSTVGGVVGWTDGGWRLTSIKPVEVTQPDSSVSDARSMAANDRAKTFKGLGWRAFAQPKNR